VQWEGTKMSKTAGTAVTLDEAIDRHGPDALRYFLLREVGFEADGNFTWERFDERYTADLADGFGNLASRSLAMLMKYRGGVVPTARRQTSLDQGGQEALRDYSRAMDALDLRGGAEAAWTLVSAANLFVQQSAPWTLAKVGKDTELDEVLSALARALCRLALMTSPFIPGKAQTLWEDLGMEGDVARTGWSVAEDPPVAGRVARKQSILFPKPVKV
jgi:methionyl-tRNA synthetase